jgi:hypothetical protein
VNCAPEGSEILSWVYVQYCGHWSKLCTAVVVVICESLAEFTY